MAAELGSLPAIPESSSEDDESERRHVRARRQPVQPPPPGWVPNGVHAPPSAEPAQPVGGPSMGTPSYVSAPSAAAAAQAMPYGAGPPGLMHRGATGFSVDPKILE